MENSSTTWSLISIIDIVLCGLIVSRSDYGKDILAKIEGFKNFIEVAEKERLEALLEDDPYYFYNTLPFAQVLGVTKKWIDKFDKISMQQPPFYNTYYPMNDIYVAQLTLHHLLLMDLVAEDFPVVAVEVVAAPVGNYK